MASPTLEDHIDTLKRILDHWVPYDQHETWKAVLCVNYFQIYPDYEFITTFRLTKSLVEEVVVQIAPYLKTCKRKYEITPLNQLLVTLRYYAEGAILDWITEFMDVTKPIAARIIKDVSAAIAKIAPKHIYIHRDTKRNFQNFAHFPEVLGLLKGTHILITPPGPSSHIESSTSINVQAVCDADYRFMHVITGWSGSAHDATIFLKSELRARCEKGEYGKLWLLGDNTYPCKPYLLTPVVNPQKRRERRYNNSHSRTMKIIDRCFESWTRRFPLLSGVISLSPKNTQNVIMATAVLHNMCRENNLDELHSPVLALHENDIHHKPSDIPESSVLNQFDQRNLLINKYFTVKSVAVYSNQTADKHTNT